MAPWFEEPIHFEPDRKRLAFRAVWISDTHLGTPGCKAELLLDFLKSIECETLFLVGDIVDGWRLKKGWYWPARHNDLPLAAPRLRAAARGDGWQLKAYFGRRHWRASVRASLPR